APRAPRRAPGLGRSAADRNSARARAVIAGGFESDDRGAARDGPSGGNAQARRCQGRGESLLRRGASRRVDRPGRIGSREGALDGSRAASGLRTSRLRSGRLVGADRPPFAGREGGASGRVRDWTLLLDGAHLRAAPGDDAGLSRARGAGSRSPALWLVNRRRDGVRLQASADARGRLRESPEGEARAPTRWVRRLARTVWRESRRPRGPAGSPLRGVRATGGRRSRLDRRRR